SDDSCNAAFCPPHQHHAKVEFNGGHRTHRRGGITQLSAQRSLQSSRVALNTFDFKAPSAPQYVEQPTLARQGDVPQLEVFDGNPAFMYRNVGEGAREARQRMEVLEWQAKLFGGASDCRSLSPGRTFQLTEHHWFDGHDDTDADFLVVSVSIDARNNHADRGNAPVYANSFSCIRRKIPYRPQRRHKKPRMPGPQTATVVGPKGQEIHTDPHGRIKVQFPWDRYGRHDERSSCWIRVSQPWAGAGWGTVAIPRIGQEVVIDYLEGDPDRPLCTGRLYNSAQPLPYALPGAAHVMGFKSRSTPGGGGFCEMVIHDRKGQELINIHSQKDMVTTVQHTQATVVNGPHQTNTVTNGFQVTKVKKRVELESQTECIHLKAATKIVLEVGASRIEMEANGKITIRGLHVDVIGTSRIDLNTNTGIGAVQPAKAPGQEVGKHGQAAVGSSEWKAERQQAQALQQPIIAPDDLIGGPLKLGAKGIAVSAGAVMGAMKSIGAKESSVLLRGGAKSAVEAEIVRIGQEGHALIRHGGAVTDHQLFKRATTGIAPDGSSVIKNGQIVIPPSSTAFNSDALLVQSDLLIRKNYLDRAIALSKPGVQRVTIEGVDTGKVIGRGFDRVSSVPGVVGPLQFHTNLSRATAVYDFDAAAGVWQTTTIYAVK
uniref:type VI secretion system tip protein TssI/VgrG n=1 Tax=Noviherbaspirillum aerium TaxID=2588497 RepID=UPI00124E8479